MAAGRGRRARARRAGRRPAAGSSATSSARERARDACEAVADHLARRGLLPSVYLAQSGRLRCQAVRGVWQVYDGVPPTTGIVGRVYRTGETAVVDDVGEAPDYLPAVPGVRSEICAPLRVGGQVVGVLDAVVGDHASTARTAAEVERCAALLSARLEEVGAVPPASPAQRLARAAAGSPCSRTPRASCARRSPPRWSWPGYESGVVALADGHGALYPHLAEGPFAVAFSQLAADELAAIARWVDDGTSSYTVGDAGGRGFAGHEVLRRLGAASLIVLPLAAAGERLGLIVVADRGNRRPACEDVELLELLAAQAAGEPADGQRGRPAARARVARSADRAALLAADRCRRARAW